MVISYLPVGSEMVTKWYVEQVLEARCGFVDCIPVFIAAQPYWQPRFAEQELPIIGDDTKSQVGATITHRAIGSRNGTAIGRCDAFSGPETAANPETRTSTTAAEPAKA